MDAEMEGIFDRCNELTQELTREYQKSAERGKVTERAKNLFHEVLVKIRSALDIAMNRVFNKHTLLTANKKAKMEREAGFPICELSREFHDRMRRLGLSGLQHSNARLYEKLRQSQPFSSENQGLLLLRDLSNLGKHVGLAPQRCRLDKAKQITGPKGTLAIFTGGAGPVGPDGKPISPAPDWDVRDIMLATFEVNHSSGRIRWPDFLCLSFCQETRHYIAQLLKLL